MFRANCASRQRLREPIGAGGYVVENTPFPGCGGVAEPDRIASIVPLPAPGRQRGAERGSGHWFAAKREHHNVSLHAHGPFLHHCRAR
jgi:hypothetical protein